MSESTPSLEHGIGPINFGTTQVEPCDGLSEVSNSANIFLKGERILFGLAFGFMLGLTCFTAYRFLYKRQMYGSYPLVFTYIILGVLSFMGVFYEFFMGFRCGDQDCFTHLLVSIMPEYRVYFFSEKHKDYLVQISILWKLRQQLLWALGMS